jgi:hypothetical protein
MLREPRNRTRARRARILEVGFGRQATLATNGAAHQAIDPDPTSTGCRCRIAHAAIDVISPPRC